jgi:predicted anti-sigma-YlaC factor YlaD
MTDPWTDRLSEYVDGELDGATRAALEAHLATCAECRRTRDELVRVVARARGVGHRAPARDLWAPIEQSIGKSRPARRLVTFSWPGLAAAAAVVALVAGGFAWTIASNRAQRGSTVVATPKDTAAPVPGAALGTSALAVASYREAAADLERAFAAGRSTLRPETMQVIEANLRAIDRAIAQTDSALQRDPGSTYLNQYLAATMQRKLKLLRRAVEITSARS